ncbi:hypothetical protein FEM48_Zijuj03G0025500 [Ziziphus jujuba var. spinosa]|uniref:Peptidase M48 domain-containing protein n=1 Tax=Ziziphus jujuba var. spinosa TaxID=714518 RepID=A0A978VMN1_ZIZJJ|nr:hypothetical protein FEM48_Zijuj03G0025500 [Ziziphus jujuba var. spinosa]
MGSNYRRLKIVVNALRGFTSRIFPLKSPIHHPRNTLLGSSILAPKSNKAKLFSGEEARRLPVFGIEGLLLGQDIAHNALQKCSTSYWLGGKIVVCIGVLEYLKSDAEIVAIITHEAGHGVARHVPENITNSFTKYMWLDILQFILNMLVNNHNFVNKMSNLLLKLPCSRRNEFEADYIGMILMASARYDPRVAPKVWRKLEGC